MNLIKYIQSATLLDGFSNWITQTFMQTMCMIMFGRVALKNFDFELRSSGLKCNFTFIRFPHSHCGLGGLHQHLSINFGG